MSLTFWKDSSNRSQSHRSDDIGISVGRNRKVDIYLFWSLLIIGTLGSLVIVHRWTHCQNKQVVIDVQKQQILQAQAKIHSLKKNVTRLEEPGVAWEKLIREKMDYARPNEVIFEFTSQGTQDRVSQ